MNISMQMTANLGYPKGIVLFDAIHGYPLSTVSMIFNERGSL